MRKLLTIIALVGLLIPSLTMGYTIQPGDTPYGIWGSNWAEQMEAQIGHSNPYALPVGVEVQLDGELGAKPIITQTSHWNRSGTVLSPAVSGDTVSVDITGNVNATNVTSTNFYGDITGSVIYNNILNIVTVTSTEEAVDGSFEDWNEIESPDDFLMVASDFDGMVYTGFEKSTDAYAGTYALELTNYTTPGGGSYISPQVASIAEATGEETVQVSLYAKSTSGTVQVGIILLCEDEEFTYYYNTSSSEWTDMDTFTGENAYEITNLTTSYALVESSVRTLPAGVSMAYYGVIGIGNEGTTFVVDNLEFLVDDSNVNTNSTMEAWTTAINPNDPLASWGLSVTDNWGQKDGNYIEQVTSTQAGDYAVKLNVSYADQVAYVYQQVTGTAGTVIDLSVYSKGGTTSGTPYMILTNSNPNEEDRDYTQVYDFVTDSWDNQDSSYPFIIGTDQALALSTSTEWTLTTATTTIPTSTELWVGLSTNVGSDDSENPYEYYFDSVSILEAVDDYEISITEPYSLVKVNSIANNSIITLDDDLLNYCSNDQIFFMTFKDQGGNSGSNNIVINTEGTALFEGNASSTISTNYGWRTLYCDGTDYFLTSRE